MKIVVAKFTFDVICRFSLETRFAQIARLVDDTKLAYNLGIKTLEYDKRK